MRMTESDVEDAALGWFEELGYAVLHGPDIGPEEPAAERDAWDRVVRRDALLPKLLSGELRVKDAGRLSGTTARV